MALPDRKRNRLVEFDYSREELYFVTSCVQDKACVFGHVANGEMHVNPYGQIAEKQWYWLAEQYPYVVLHAFVVMPNHVHGIIEIDQSLVGTGRDLSAHTPNVSAHTPNVSAHTPNVSAHTTNISGLPPILKIKSLSELMGVYKTTTSKLIRQSGLTDFAWQRSFHDHIIRHESAFRKIEQYINHNPALWQEDVFYMESPS